MKYNIDDGIDRRVQTRVQLLVFRIRHFEFKAKIRGHVLWPRQAGCLISGRPLVWVNAYWSCQNQNALVDKVRWWDPPKNIPPNFPKKPKKVCENHRHSRSGQSDIARVLSTGLWPRRSSRPSRQQWFLSGRNIGFNITSVCFKYDRTHYFCWVLVRNLTINQHRVRGRSLLISRVNLTRRSEDKGRLTRVD